MSKLAVIDWGIGGLGFYREWKKNRPDEEVLYFSDSGYTPYGKLSEKQLTARLYEVFGFLSDAYGITHFMVACNAASSVMDGDCVAEHYEAIGVIDGTVEFIQTQLTGEELTILGGNRIIESKAYSKKLPNFNLLELSAQPLSALVERGVNDGCEAEYAVREVFDKVTNDVVLACTHYVALGKLIGEIYPSVNCYDPIPYIVEKMLTKWGKFDTGEDSFITTGNAKQSNISAKLAFGVDADFFPMGELNHF